MIRNVQCFTHPKKCSAETCSAIATADVGITNSNILLKRTIKIIPTKAYTILIMIIPSKYVGIFGIVTLLENENISMAPPIMIMDSNVVRIVKEIIFDKRYSEVFKGETSAAFIVPCSFSNMIRLDPFPVDRHSWVFDSPELSETTDGCKSPYIRQYLYVVLLCHCTL